MTQVPPPAVPPTTPPAPQAPVQRLAPHRGTAVLVLGILGLACCVICGIIAWVMGKNDLAEMDAGRMDPTGRGMTNAGKICGMISVIINIVGIVLYVLYMLVIFLFVGAAAVSS